MQGGPAKVTMLVVALVVGVTAAWVGSRYELTVRLTDLVDRIHAQELGPARGLRSTPTEELLQQRIRTAAEEIGLSVESCVVDLNDLGGGDYEVEVDCQIHGRVMLWTLDENLQVDRQIMAERDGVGRIR